MQEIAHTDPVVLYCTHLITRPVLLIFFSYLLVRTRFSPLIVGQKSQRVSVSDGFEFEQIETFVHFVEFVGHVATSNARFDQFQTSSMYGQIVLPIFEMRVRTIIEEKRPFQCSEVAVC